LLLDNILDEKVTVGAEIEFYLNSMSIEELSKRLPEYSFIKERGNSQIEYHIGPSFDYDSFLNEIESSIKKIKVATSNQADFSPKPYKDDYGSSLQFQISSSSLLFQEKLDDICASFCHYACETFLAYAPADEDYERFTGEYMAPSHISFGNNNRTCLIRINGDLQKRIEVRSPSPSCDTYIVLCTILTNLYRALTEESRLEQYPKIYGNSYDVQYNLKKLPKNIEESANEFKEDFFSIIANSKL